MTTLKMAHRHQDQVAALHLGQDQVVAHLDQDQVVALMTTHNLPKLHNNQVEALVKTLNLPRTRW